MEFAPLGEVGGAFLTMAVSVGDPSSVHLIALNREMGCDAVGQVFQNAISVVWIQTGVGAAPPAGSCSLDRVVDFDRALARSALAC